MALSDQVKDALRSIFGREREERSAAESPSAEAEANTLPASYGVMGTTETAGLLSVSNKLMDRYADYECFTGETPVITLQGPVAIAELAERCRLDPDYQVSVYTWDHEKDCITVGTARQARQTKVAEVVEVEIDDGFVFRCTPDHPIMLRSGQYCPAGDLKPGTSLMPLYLRVNKRGYQQYKQNGTWRRGAENLVDQWSWRHTSRMVGEWKLGRRLPPQTAVRFKDGDRSNNHPDNLEIVFNALRKPTMKPPPFVKAVSAAQDFVGENAALTEISKRRRREAFKKLYNHKVVAVRRAATEPVYDLAVFPTRNFAIGGPTGGVFVHNCFAPETKIFDNHQLKAIGDLTGQEIMVTCADGVRRPGTVKSYGVQPVNKITLKPLRSGKSLFRRVVRATGNHRWYLEDGTVTYDLKPGDRLKAAHLKEPQDESDEGFMHGFVYADGARSTDRPIDGESRFQLRLCGRKGTYFDRLAPLAYNISRPASYDGDPTLYFESSRDLKSVPDERVESEDYIASFISGWLCADGCKVKASGVWRLDTHDHDAGRWFTERAPFYGYEVMGVVYSEGLASDERNHSTMCISTRPGFRVGYEVESVESDGEEEVFCLTEPVTHSVTLAGAVLSGQSMNDYPEVHCFAEGTKVFVKTEEGAITPVNIELLVGEELGCQLVAFDRKKHKLCFVDPQHARLESNEAEVIRIPLSNGRSLRVTPDHLILVNGLGYIEAKELEKGAELIGFMPGLDTTRSFMLTNFQSGIVTVTEDPVPDGVARVFDITTETHNFIAEGVVCHNSAFHYFANDATQPNADTGKMIWCESADAAIKSTANATLHKKLRIDDEMFSIAYTTAMYGNDFEEVLVTENGVVGLNFLPPPTVRRIERADGALIGYIQDLSGQFPTDMRQLRTMLDSAQGVPAHIALFEDWQVLHFRQRGSFRRSPYGFSVAEGARWIWKRLLILEDAVLIYKLSRAPSRYAFYIDVTDIPPDRVKSFLNKAKNDLKKKQIVDPRTGKLTMRFNPLANDEDFFLATREGKDLARVDILSGPDYQAVEDVMYFLRKLHGVLKVPRSYMGFDDQVPGRSILSNEDVRAARVTLGLQRSLRMGFERLIRVDMAARGMSNVWRPEFDIMMTAPSAIYSLAAMEWKNATADFASRVQPFTSLRWVQENVFKFSGEEIDAIEKQVKREREMGVGGGMDMGGFVGASIEDIPREPLLERDRDDIPTRRQLIKMIDGIRRNEDRRHQESLKRHDLLLESMHHMSQQLAGFNKRLRNYQSFGQDMRNGVLNSRNGRINPAPVNRNIRRLAPLS